jgi:hypothetical protein
MKIADSVTTKPLLNNKIGNVQASRHGAGQSLETKKFRLGRAVQQLANSICLT